MASKKCIVLFRKTKTKSSADVPLEIGQVLSEKLFSNNV